MKRRAFLGSLVGIPAAAWLSPNVLATAAPIQTQLIGDINAMNRATFAFWRNQPGYDPLNMYAVTPSGISEIEQDA